MQSMRLFWGLVILTLGVTFIAVNQGWLSSSIWPIIFSLWPLILVVWGLKLIIRNEKILSLIVLIIFFISTMFVVYFFNTQNTFTVLGQNYSENLTDTYNTSEIKKVNVVVTTGATLVNIYALPKDLGNTNLYQVKTKNMGRVVISKNFNNNQADLAIEEQTDDINVSGMTNRQIDIGLPASVLIDLKLESGASKVTLDLSSLQIQGTVLKIGASKADIYLGEREANQNISIDAGASDINIYIPAGVAIKASLEGGVNNINVDPTLNIQKNGNTYTSNNFEQAPTKVVITGSVGVSNIKFQAK